MIIYNSRNLLKIKKDRTGDIIFEISPSISLFSPKNIAKVLMKLILILFFPIFSFFDKLAEKRKLVVSGVGLGIGLGLSIIVTQRPDALQAFPILMNANIEGVQAKEIKIPALDLYASVKSDELTNFVENVISNELIHLKGSGYLGQNKPIVIADLSSKDIIKNIEEIEIGTEIILTGNNNGIYKYHVIETRETDAQYLPHVIAKEENTLIIYKSTNLIRTRLFIVVAKPYK